MKKKSLKSAKNKAWKAFSLYIRMRDCIKSTGKLDYGQCFTCGAYHFIQDLDAGHFLQGRHLSTMFDELNVHQQCTNCNRFKHGNLIAYTFRMQFEYGQEAINALIERNNQTKKYTVADYEEIYQKYTLMTKIYREKYS